MCIHVRVWKVLIWQIFNRLFLLAAAVASPGYQTFCSFGVRRVLTRCGQSVPVLKQVRAWGTSEGPVFQHGFFTNAAGCSSHGSTKACSFTATQVSRPRRHATAHFRNSDQCLSPQTFVGSHNYCGHWVWSFLYIGGLTLWVWHLGGCTPH